jgi:hypothetical protein
LSADACLKVVAPASVFHDALHATPARLQSACMLRPSRGVWHAESVAQSTRESVLPNLRHHHHPHRRRPAQRRDPAYAQHARQAGRRSAAQTAAAHGTGAPPSRLVVAPCAYVCSASTTPSERATVGRGAGVGVLLVQCAFQCGVDLAAQGDMASRKGSSGRRGIAMRRRGRYLDEILMVGGATRMPAVRRFVENMTVRPSFLFLPSSPPLPSPLPCLPLATCRRG